MREQLMANVTVNLRFIRRNRLLWVVGLVMALPVSLNLLFALYMFSSNQKLTQLGQVFQALNGFAFLLTSVLGLFVVSAPIRNKSLKVTLTRPCTPETWLASCVGTVLLIAVALYGAILILIVGASLSWGVPVQTGFAYGAIRELLVTAVAVAFVALLATAFHPVAAGLAALLFYEGTWYGLKFLLDAKTLDGGGRLGVRLVDSVVTGVYYLVPTYDPFADRTAAVYASMRTSGTDWLCLLGTAAYAVAAVALLYQLACWTLRRRSLA